MAFDRSLTCRKLCRMNIEESVQILRELVSVSLLVASPFLAVSVSVGLAVSLVQAVSRIPEALLPFIP